MVFVKWFVEKKLTIIYYIFEILKTNKNNLFIISSFLKRKVKLNSFTHRATFVDVSKKFCLAPLQSKPIATKSRLYSFIMILKSL